MQGPVGAPMPPRDAAISRFHRGAPLVGWHPILPSGAPAPAWQLADPIAMVDLLQSEMLEPLRQMVLLAGSAHCHHAAIPSRIERRGAVSVASVRLSAEDSADSEGFNYTLVFDGE